MIFSVWQEEWLPVQPEWMGHGAAGTPADGYDWTEVFGVRPGMHRKGWAAGGALGRASGGSLGTGRSSCNGTWQVLVRLPRADMRQPPAWRDMAGCPHMMPPGDWTATLSAPYYRGNG
jgi:hypothetical protein